MPVYKTNLEIQIKQDQKQGMGLIDHEQTDTFPVWKFRGSSLIYEESKCIALRSDQVYQESNEELPNKNSLVRILKASMLLNYVENQYEILLAASQQTFIVVKDIKSSTGPEYPLSVNSIIRLGRVYYIYVFQREYRVIEERNKHMQTFQAPCMIKNVCMGNNNITYQCKFCFMEGKQSRDSLFLTNICRCVGNSKAVHLDCLRFWVDQNITKEETQFGLTLKWSKPHECSICKDSLPIRVQYENQYYDLFTLERPDLQYILMQVSTPLNQNVNRDKNLCTEIYLIHGLLSDNIKIGRAFTCDIKAQDITVSRHHATIKLCDGNFVISDNKSKFGTLVSIDKRLEIDCAACSFQIGKLLINFIQSDFVHKSAPSTQHKLTQLPQINKQLEEDEPQMDDDSFQLENK